MSVAIPDVDAGAPDLSEAERHIRRWIEGKRENTDTAHRDADVLMHLYWDREMPQARVAEELDCGAGTVSEWLNKTGVGARDRIEASRETNWIPHATFGHTHGHEYWKVEDPDKTKSVAVHQLLAVADGADPHEVWADGTEVHHSTHIPWLNLPGFVEVLTRSEHTNTHRADEWTTEDGIPVLETQG